jgi:hypothetical protein
MPRTELMNDARLLAVDAMALQDDDGNDAPPTEKSVLV